MSILLQAMTNPSVLDKFSSFHEIVQYLGPTIAFSLLVAVPLLQLQRYWCSKTLKAKDAEIKRDNEREKELYERLIKLIDSILKK